MLKRATFRSTLATIACAISLSAQAMADEQKQIDIPSGDLTTALELLSKQAAVDLVYQPDQIKNYHTQGVRGIYTPEAAIRILLQGTPLGLHIEATGAMAIAPLHAIPSTDNVSSRERKASEDTSSREENLEGSLQESAAEHVRMAQATQGASAEIPSRERENGEQSAQKESVRLEEVVVTAQKKSERLLEVPVAVTVLNTEYLAENNKTRLQDYFASVPGLSLFQTGGVSGGQNIQIRGLSTSGFDATNPTVAFLVDGVAVGGSTRLSFSNSMFPDVDPSDIDRVEVLKGPQGTLYGADSLGGLINIITKDPSTNKFAAQTQVVGEGMPNAGTGYALRASVNVPVSDALAVRLSGFARQDPGFIDNLANGQRDVNSTDAYGLHLAALFRPSEDFALKLAALIQRVRDNGASIVDATLTSNGSLQPASGDLKQTVLPGTGQSEVQTGVYTATLNSKLSSVDITSVTGYTVGKRQDNYDATAFFGTAALGGNLVFVPGATASSFPGGAETKKFSEEVRLSSSIGRAIDWLAGGFYTHETSPTYEHVNVNDPVTGAVRELIWTEADGYYGVPPIKFSEGAVFADVTFHVTPRFDIQVGGRQSWNSQSYDQEYFGVANSIFNGSPLYSVRVPTQKGSDSAFTYLFTSKYQISSDLMVYGRIASGYQIGGTNPSSALLQSPPTYSPSTTTNYEIGTKGLLFDGRMTFELSAFYIDWNKIQITVEVPGTFDNYVANAAHAKSEGIEASVKLHPLPGSQISAVASYDDAELTKGFPSNAPSYGIAGEQLPHSMRYSGSLSADQDLAHIGTGAAFVGGTVNYVGRRYGEFTGSATQLRIMYPGYTTVDLRAGIRWDTWLVNAFLNNVADTRGTISGSYSGSIAQSAYFAVVSHPRTIGVSVSKSF